MAGLFGAGPSSNILQTVQSSYGDMLNAEKQKGVSAQAAMGAFGQAISPKAIGMNQFKNDFKDADWSKPETYQRAGEQIMQFDPNGGLAMMDKGRVLASSLVPKTDRQFVETVDAEGKPIRKLVDLELMELGSTISSDKKPTATKDTYTGAQLMLLPKYKGMVFDPTTVYQVDSATDSVSPVSKTGESESAFISSTKTGQQLMDMPENKGKKYDPTTVFKQLPDQTWQPISKTGEGEESKGTTLRQNAKTIAGEGASEKQVVQVMRQLGGIASDMQVPVGEIIKITNSFQTATDTERKRVKGADYVIDLTAEDTFRKGMKADEISSIADNLTRSLFGDNALKAQAEMDNFRNSKKFTLKVRNAFSNFFDGTHTAETLKGFQELAKFVKEREMDSYNDKRQAQANALGVSSNLKPDQIETILGPVKGMKWIQPDGTPYPDANYELNGDMWRVRNGIGYIKYKKGEF